MQRVAAACAVALVGCGPGVPGEVIATTSPFAAGLIQDADFLYWRTQDALIRLSKQGGTPETIISGRSPVAETVSGDRIFWLDQEAGKVSLRSAANTGGGELVLDSDEGAGGKILGNLTTDGTFLYWSNETGGLRRAPVTGGEAINFFAVMNTTIESLDTIASAVAAIDGVVFATTFFSILRLQEGAAPRAMLATRFDGPQFVTLANPPDAFFYWVERGTGARNGAVYRAAQVGSEPVLLARGEVAPGRPSTDGQSVYFATGGQDDRIRRARVSRSSDAEDFASGEVGDPVVDGSHVYWIDREGRVHKAPKVQ